MATLAEFRQQHPEYSNRSDMELARALHGKYYSQIEFGTFARQIGMLDEPVVKPTADYDAMSERREREGGGPKLTQPVEYRTALEGAGKFFTDMGLGARQLLGAVGRVPTDPKDPASARQLTDAANAPSGAQDQLQQEAQTKRETDAPLMETGAGKAGYVGAGVLSTLPAGAIPGAASIPGSALLGMGFGALQPTTAPGERLANTAVGGVTGAAIPAALKYLPQAKGFAQSLLRPNRPPLLPEGGSVGASASAASAAAARTSPLVQSAVAKLESTRTPVNMDALARYADADTLPIPGRITRGQATRDPVKLSEERNTRAADPRFAELFKEQHETIVKNLSALRDEVGPNVFSTNPVEHGDTLIRSYKQIDAAAEANIGALYKQLEDSFGSQVPIDAKRLWTNARNALHKELMFDHAPAPIVKKLEELAESKTMTFENFESLRTQLARIQRSPTADGNLKHAAGIIRSQMEELPLFPGSGAERMKPIADAARAAARARFKALEADPAYEAAVNGTVKPDHFVQKFVIGGTRDDVTKMRAALANDPAAVETIGTAAFDHLRNTAGVDAFGNGAFSQARFNKQLTALDPKMHDLFTPATAERLRQLGRYARSVQEEVPGSYVISSERWRGTAAEGMVNFQFGGLPVGTLGRSLFNKATLGREFKRSMDPLVGLRGIGRPPAGQP